MNLRKELEKYDRSIEQGNVKLDKNYTCTLCNEDFHYRPFSCRVICNKCLKNEEFITVLGFPRRN